LKENINIAANQKHLTEKVIPFDALVSLPPNTFLNVDCMQLMKEMPDGFIDLAIVDPPYGINVNQMNMGSRQTVRPTDKIWDASPPTADYFAELFRVSKNQIIWGGNYFDLPPTRCFITWDKGEMMYGRSFAECELAWTSFDKSARMFKINPTQLDRIHPTQKPIKLYEKLLMLFAKAGDLILDTHVGSGSSLVACIEGGFNYYGAEIDKDYYDAACKRIARAFRQFELTLE
jgi:site-specific DNA-methyltransferase (adenine-specific)